MQQTVLADDTLELSLANDLREMSVVAAEIDEFCTAQHLATEIAYAANLAIEELLTNSISHGYDDDEPHRIEIMLRREPDDLVIVIVDDSAAVLAAGSTARWAISRTACPIVTAPSFPGRSIIALRCSRAPRRSSPGRCICCP